MINRLYIELKMHPLPNHVNRLLDTFKVNGISVPSGYITNGADVPRLFWSIQPPNDTRVMPGVVVHDYMCDLAKLRFIETGSIKTALRFFHMADKELKTVLRDNLGLGGVGVWLIILGTCGYTRLFRGIELLIRKRFFKYDKRKLKRKLCMR